MVEQVLVTGGRFLMGSEGHYPEEAPEREVRVQSFFIDTTAVTNEEFSVFVESTEYVTLAELPPNPRDYPGMPVNALAPGSLVFTMTSEPVGLGDFRQWWAWVPHANWRHPTGPGSDLDGLERHPVVHIAYPDAVAYAGWAGKDLPSEAEWEYAARGGIEGAEFPWGDDDSQETAPKANTWQGRFPHENTAVDGWVRTSPVGSYPPNDFGLYDSVGNVWEWTSDWYTTKAQSTAACCGHVASGPSEADSYDPAIPEVRMGRKVIKGGSHLCTRQYCFRYRPAARQPQMIDTSTSHLGFRCISRVS